MSEKAFCSQVLLQSDFKHNDKFMLKISKTLNNYQDCCQANKRDPQHTFLSPCH